MKEPTPSPWDGEVIFDLELVPTCLINIDLELHEIINLASSLDHLYDYSPSCDLCVIEKENNFKQPGDRYKSFSPDQDKNGSTTKIIGALSDPRGTHEIRKGVVIFDLELVPTCLINIDLELHEIINLASSLEHLYYSSPSCDLVYFGPTCSYFTLS
ncbi:hypothetical protein Tco_1385287 [Tanacetum coccineum]